MPVTKITAIGKIEAKTATVKINGRSQSLFVEFVHSNILINYLSDNLPSKTPVIYVTMYSNN